MGQLQNDDERKLLAFRKKTLGDSYRDLNESTEDGGMDVSNNTISKYSKKFEDVSASEIDVNNVREELLTEEAAKKLKNSEAEADSSDTSDSGELEAEEIEEVEADVSDQRKDKGSSEDSGSFELADPTKKAHIAFVKSNTDVRNRSQAQQTLLNMREDNVKIDTENGEAKKED